MVKMLHIIGLLAYCANW